MQSRLPSDVDEKATNPRLINRLIPTLTRSTLKRAVSYVATRWRVQQEAILQAGRLWNEDKHIFKISKGLWVKWHGCGLTLEAEEGILWPRRGFIYSLLWTEMQELFQFTHQVLRVNYTCVRVTEKRMWFYLHTSERMNIFPLAPCAL